MKKNLLYAVLFLCFSMVSCAKNEKMEIPSLLELGSNRCAPCRMMKPIIKELKKEYKGIIDIKIIDLDKKENLKIARKHKIEAIPTQIFLDTNGKELWRHTGYIPKVMLIAKFKALGYKTKEISKKE